VAPWIRHGAFFHLQDLAVDSPYNADVTPRERTIETLTFGHPDKIPFEPGNPRESTLAAWRRQGLPQDADWSTYLFDLLGIDQGRRTKPKLGVDFRMIPQFAEEVIEHKQGHYIVQDWKGNICEISDEFDVTYLRQAKDFVTRRWIRCPVQGRDDWEQMKLRYDVDSPERFPDDFEELCNRLTERQEVLTISFSGPFWQMREWCGFEPLCVMMIEQAELVDEMADFWRGFVSEMLARVLRHITPDRILINEDMAYKHKAMISPAMVRRFCKPCYDQWSRLARAAQVPLIEVDSDGYIAELLPIWIECGINVTVPLEVAAGNDICEYRRRFGRRMAYHGGVDKRAIAAGGEVLRRELARIEPVVRDGGYIPGCDHAVPPDVSWPNYLEYSRRLAEMTGWM